jgi:hypothetical protein
MSGSVSNSPNDLLPTYSQRDGERIKPPRIAPRRTHVRESRG